MGWAYGVNQEGREVGYGVEATCDQRGCAERIDRGLGYVCGGMHDGGYSGCGRYFCGSHLYLASRRGTMVCGMCLNWSQSGRRRKIDMTDQRQVSELIAAAEAFADFLALRDVTVWLQTRAEYDELQRLHGRLRDAIKEVREQPA